MTTVFLYYSSLVENDKELINILDQVKKETDFTLVKIDYSQKSSDESNISKKPYLMIGPYKIELPVTKSDIEIAINANEDRVNRINLHSKKDIQFLNSKNKINNSDRFGYWLSNHYMLLFNLLVFFYLGLPTLAPVFMKVGAPGIAKPIYTIYSPLCHQLAFRSFFLFGDQLFYPRELAGIPSVKPYEEYISDNRINIFDARKFVGNETMGYKLALCERDYAIYGSILLFGIIFSFTKRRIKPFPWYLWIIFGLGPIGVDGISQLPGLLESSLPSWIMVRESTPFLRLITGGMFGVSTAWYVYPIIQETMDETKKALIRKFAAYNQGIEK